MPKRLDELTIVEARSLALAAQGFDKPRPKDLLDVEYLTRE